MQKGVQKKNLQPPANSKPHKTLKSLELPLLTMVILMVVGLVGSGLGRIEGG